MKTKIVSCYTADSKQVKQEVKSTVILPPLVFLGTVDLLVLTSLVQLIFILKILFTYFTKQVTLMRRSTVLNLPLQLVFLAGLFVPVRPFQPSLMLGGKTRWRTHNTSFTS